MKTDELTDVREVKGEVMDDDTTDELTDACYHLESCATLLAALGNSQVVRKFTDTDRERCNQLAKIVREFTDAFDY